MAHIRFLQRFQHTPFIVNAQWKLSNDGNETGRWRWNKKYPDHVTPCYCLFVYFFCLASEEDNNKIHTKTKEDCKQDNGDEPLDRCLMKFQCANQPNIRTNWNADKLALWLRKNLEEERGFFIVKLEPDPESYCLSIITSFMESINLGAIWANPLWIFGHKKCVLLSCSLPMLQQYNDGHWMAVATAMMAYCGAAAASSFGTLRSCIFYTKSFIYYGNDVVE